jgi:hypothetical protein
MNPCTVASAAAAAAFCAGETLDCATEVRLVPPQAARATAVVRSHDR